MPVSVQEQSDCMILSEMLCIRQRGFLDISGQENSVRVTGNVYTLAGKRLHTPQHHPDNAPPSAKKRKKATVSPSTTQPHDGDGL